MTLLQACLHNAGDLLTDARLLLEAGRAPRAHALATLAFEETGKAFICIPALLPVPEPFFGSRGHDFWAAWNSPTDKLTWARGFLALLMASIAQVVQTDPDTAVALGRRMLQDGLSGELPSGGTEAISMPPGTSR